MPFASRRIHLRRIRPWHLGLVLGVCVILAAAGLTWAAVTPSQHKVQTARPTATSVHVTPPTRVCGNRAILGGGPGHGAVRGGHRPRW